MAFPEEQISTKASPTSYVTGWEAAPAGRLTGTTADHKNFSFVRTTPQVTPAVASGGAVLVFIRDYALHNDHTNLDDQPVALPYTAAHPLAKEVSPPLWTSTATSGQVNVNLRVIKSAPVGEQNLPKVQFRYFILTPEFMAQHKVTPDYMKGLSYNEVLETVGAGQ